MSHAVLNGVTPHVRTTRRVIASDIAGFGLTPSLPGAILPTIPNLVDGLEESLRRIGVDIPLDIAGNSLGATMALSAARRGLARSVVAISHACLWGAHGARHVKHVFAGPRFMTRKLPQLWRAAVQSPLMRELILAVPLSMGSRRMPGSDAVRAVDDLANSTAFELTFESVRSPFHGTDIIVPVTVEFGDRDWILPKSSQRKSAPFRRTPGGSRSRSGVTGRCGSIRKASHS